MLSVKVTVAIALSMLFVVVSGLCPPGEIVLREVPQTKVREVLTVPIESVFEVCAVVIAILPISTSQIPPVLISSITCADQFMARVARPFRTRTVEVS